MPHQSIALAKEMIADCDRIAAFTGAGVSAESGIPTYRGHGGAMWKEYDPDKYANIDFFHKDPSYFWSFFRDVRYRTLVDSQPNVAHRAIAELESRGKLFTVITQNIDGLHRKAGNTNVIELHGNTRVIGCLDCEADYDFEEIQQQVQKEIPPLCRRCSGLLKPRVTFFGEALPPGALELATQAALSCKLMLVVGSTLGVFPAASMPLLAKRAGAQLVIVNYGPTAMDELADARVEAKAGEVLPEIVGI